MVTLDRSSPAQFRLISGVAVAVMVALIAAACSASAEIAEQPGPPAIATTVADPPSTPRSESFGSIDDAAGATVKIVSPRSEWEPFAPGPTEIEGLGSGFMINAEGVAITTFHSFGNTTAPQVYLSGATEPIGATVLGISECSDLAVIDIDGEGYDFLDFRTAEVKPGLPVWAAGYPVNLATEVGDIDYTLTAGSVNTIEAQGEDVWVSVDGVVEHDARIRGGNSGGPLVDENGDVVGINFAGDDVNDLNFAIDTQRILPLLELLSAGDAEAVGIEGSAASEGSTLGIWVSSVRAGSAAEAAGVMAGDVITSVGGEKLGVDRPFGQYCKALREAGDDGVLSIEVARTTTGETLAGEFNGAALQVTAERSSDSGPYRDFEFVADETRQIGLDVPMEWTDRNGESNDEFGPSIWASPDLEAFQATWDVPGVILEVNAELTSTDIDAVLDDLGGVSECVANGRENFTTPDGTFVGKRESFTACDGTNASVLHLAASRADGTTVVRMIFQAVDDRDDEALDAAFLSFDVSLADE